MKWKPSTNKKNTAKAVDGIDGATDGDHGPPPGRQLTAREIEVLGWIAEGKRDSEIGTIIGTSARTVQKHVQHILKKLNVETRTAAAVHLLNHNGRGDRA